ncbi:CidA/LrgA family protein [Christensenella tenuis]|jgi:holin-like protein|uniref:CidA/LrgA family protein n=1 Tax=Christensenella tenuis TaxID=2763033 RepID=A0ABR7EAS4_9FIRM|nr:CidA/LrgA family protein [Christensenella tenuis]MBC5646857.1 CidA/LrgA family protein [Christensenella tenuis]
MKSLFQVGIVLAVCLAGELVSEAIPAAIPTSVISMILLFVLLLSKCVKPRHIEQFSDFLLKNMAFFFIPAGVAIMEQFDLLKNYLFPFLLICFITTIITFFATAYTVKAVMAAQKRVREDKRHE